MGDKRYTYMFPTIFPVMISMYLQIAYIIFKVWSQKSIFLEDTHINF